MSSDRFVIIGLFNIAAFPKNNDCSYPVRNDKCILTNDRIFLI